MIDNRYKSNRTLEVVINQLIDKIESIFSWFQVPSRRKVIEPSTYILILAYIVWAIFFVPDDILNQSVKAQSLVDFTTGIFPWLDFSLLNYGEKAQKSVFMQSLSIWVLFIPSCVFFMSTGVNSRLGLVDDEVMDKKVVIKQGFITILLLSVILYANYSHTPIPRSSSYLGWQVKPYISVWASVFLSIAFCVVILTAAMTTLYAIQQFFIQKNKTN